MWKTTIRLELVACLFWSCFDLYGCSGPHQLQAASCNHIESYKAVETVSVQEPVTVTKYEWCFKFPPRCPQNKREFRTVQKNNTVIKTRIVKKCCEDHVRLHDECIPKCTNNRCPNVQCEPDTDKCVCKPGYIGRLCEQRCDVDRWGPDCQNSCHAACLDCDHRTGCCVTALTNDADDRNETAAPLRFCAEGTPSTAASSGDVHQRAAAVEGAVTARESATEETTARGSATEETTARGSATEVATAWGTATAEMTTEKQAAPPNSIRMPPRGLENGGRPYVSHTVTATMEVKVYNKYDDLVKKLVWISAMTVAAIAMVFVIMFVVFFNCYSVQSRVSADCRTSKSRRPSVLMQASAADQLRTHETCFGTDKLGHITPDRYTETPGLQKSTKNDFPLHPEIFFPVFSAPHCTKTRSSLYDCPRPQPLYEVLC